MFHRPFAATVLALGLLVACGSQKSPGSAGDGGGTVGDGGPSPGSLTPGTASLDGPSAFPVAWAWMTPQGSSACGATGTLASGVAAVAIELFEDDEQAVACTDGGDLVTGGKGHDIDLEIATTQYVQGEALTQALGPGTYVVGDEGENDPDICMIPSGTNAYLALLDFGVDDDAVAIAVSGTVTIDSISSQGITGSFDVFLGGPYGTTDAGVQSLTGAFNTVTCP